MDENNRLNRRSRPRPFDLRRKVLLKNFLREQMTYIPPAGEMSQISLEISNGTNLVDGSSTDTIQTQETPNDENNADLLISLSEPEPSSSVSLVNDINSELNQRSDVSDSSNDDIDKNTAKSSLSAISRFSNIIRSRSKRKKKGITKAKLICKPVKSPEKAKSETVRFGNMFRRKSITQCKQPLSASLRKKSASKSFFSLFKARKSNKKQDKSVASVQNLSSLSKDCESSASIESCSTSTQAVQTDLTWSSNELNEIEHSNRLLREENRLLSDSLSYFMSDARTNFNNNAGHETVNHPSHDLNSSTLESLPFNNRLGSKQLFYSPDAARKGLILRSKVLRSKSVQERSKSDAVRICHRTRSVNYHEGRRNHFISNFPSRPSRELSFQQIGARTRSSTDHIRNLGSPNNRRVPVLRSFPLNNNRVLQRRSSMPERANLENVRLAYRRPHSVRDYNRPRPAVPFRILPTEAFY
ncbi:hypothetical protein X975_11796, partial [Stegodyphus mimosarum]